MVKNSALRKLFRYRAWLIVAATLLLCFTVRVRLRDMPLEGDEGEYAYAGQLMLQGIPPYSLAYNMKLPGTYATYALIMAIFGQTPAAIHIGVALINAASIILVFLIGRRLLDATTGAVAAVSYGLLSLSPSVLGLAGHATHFVVLPALGGVWLLMSEVRSPAGVPDKPQRRKEHRDSDRHSSVLFAPLWFIESLWDRLTSNTVATLVISGLLFGMAFLMKQHGVFFGIFAGLYLLWCRFGPLIIERAPEARQRRRYGRHRSRSTPQPPRSTVTLRGLFLLTFSFFIPYAVTCLVLLLAGVFPQFWFWTVSYAGKYASTVPIIYGPDLFKNALETVIGPGLIFWILAGLGLAWLFWEDRWANETTDHGPRTTDHGPRTSDHASRITHHASTDTPTLRHSDTAPLPPINPPIHQSNNPSIPSPLAFTLLFLLCSFASVSVGFHYRSHYFITLLPALALLTGLAVSRALYLLQRVKTLELFLALPVPILFLVGIIWSLAGNGPIWFTLPPDVAQTAVYHSTAQQAAAQIARFIRNDSAQRPVTVPNSQTSPIQQSTNPLIHSSGLVAVVGSEPEIYFLSRRRSATGYLYMFPLMEIQPYALKMQEEMIAQIETNKPEYVIYCDDDLSWLKWSRSELKIFDWWKNYWPENLDLVQTIPIKEQHAESLWEKTPDLEPASNADGTPKVFLLFKRKSDR